MSHADILGRSIWAERIASTKALRPKDAWKVQE